MKNRIITISREFGSGGRTIGKQVAEKLGIACYDQELIEKIAEQSGYSEEFVREKSEYTTYGSWFANAFADRDVRGMTIQDHIWTMQRQLIIDLAKKENCVIIGRCADYILRDEADLLTVFIHAGMQQRAERIVRVYGEREDSPEKRLKDKDKRRRAYYQFYTDMEWGDVCNYQIALDSGALGIETCADLIARLY
jgi:cytidylate kinase